MFLLWQFLPSEIHIPSSKETGAGQKERDREIRNDEEREMEGEKDKATSGIYFIAAYVLSHGYFI